MSNCHGRICHALSPLRLSLGGGGTDLPSFYEQHGAFFVSAAINLNVMATIKESSLQGKEESAIASAVMKRFGSPACNYQFQSYSEVPIGCGLGGSASFTTALIKALIALKKQRLSRKELAEAAFDIEHHRLGRSCGKQDQYSSVFGGLKAYSINREGQVSHKTLSVSAEFLKEFERSLLLVATGITRDSEQLLKEQHEKSKQQDKAMMANLLQIKEMGLASFKALEQEDFLSFAELVKAHWQLKEARSKTMSNKTVSDLYEFALNNGAISGKLIGAGGGGFMLFCVQNKEKLRQALARKKIKTFEFSLDHEGTRIIKQ
jgi:D-glycero-alpha-D-manno-heptose-7-phosphate kinase